MGRNNDIFLEETRTEVRVIFPDFVLRKGSSIKIRGKSFKETKNYFEREFPSTGINICTANLRTLNIEEKEYHPNEIKCKYVALSLQQQGQMLFVPLLHTLKNE